MKTNVTGEWKKEEAASRVAARRKANEGNPKNHYLKETATEPGSNTLQGSSS
jgi:hypothetical protein